MLAVRVSHVLLSHTLAPVGRNWISYPLRNTLCNDGNGFDLGALHQFHGGTVDGTRGGKVDDGVDVGVFGHGLGNVLVDGEKGLAGAPVPVSISLGFWSWNGRSYILLTN